MGIELGEGDELEHHGVKGMHWGIRNDKGQVSGVSKTTPKLGKSIKPSPGRPEKGYNSVMLNSKNPFFLGARSQREHKRNYTNDVSTPEFAKKAYARAAKDFQPKLNQINKDPKFADISTNRHAQARYDRTVMKEFNKQLKKASYQGQYSGTIDVVVFKINRRTGKMEGKFNNKRRVPGPSPLDTNLNHPEAFGSRGGALKQDAVSDPGGIDFDLEFDDNGYITGFSYPDPTVAQDDMVGDFLDHHGVKGMHWGVHTKAPISKREAKARAQRQMHADRRRHLSDGDLKKYVERLQQEKKLRELTEEDLHPGKASVKKILNNSGTKVAGTVVTGALIVGIQKAFEKKGWDSGKVDTLLRGGLKKK